MNSRDTFRVALSAIVSSLVLGCADFQQDAELGELANALELATESLFQSTAPEIGVSSSAATVVTSQGALQGRLSSTGTQAFLGIPYAQPPVGALRFRPPQPVRQGQLLLTRIADSFGPACVQPRGAFTADGPQSEDCLTLNVYVPRLAGSGVLVFIHGGAFVTGAGSQFDGQVLAEKAQAIVVTINYRLGALGFLSLPQLDAEGGVPSGNNAMRDQQLALTWVKNNIRAFGGDPANITVFGQSAGAVSTCVQMVSPLSRTLANRFILQSGTCDSVSTTATLAQARATSAKVVDAFCAGRSDLLGCLRGIPASDLAGLAVQRSILDIGWLPVVNPADPLLPQSPRDLITSGNYNTGGVIVGTNAREFGLFQQSGAAPIARSIAELNAVIDAQFGPLSPLIKQQYAAASDADANATLVRLGTDLVFRCPARMLARRTSARGSKAFLYHFEEGDALHAFELPYVFGTPNPRLGAATLVEPVRQEFQSAFVSFARTSEPRPFVSDNGILVADLPPWPGYTTATDRHIAIKNPVTQGAGLSKADCDFLESIGAVQ